MFGALPNGGSSIYSNMKSVVDKLCEANPDGTISPDETDSAQAVFDDVTTKLEALLGDATTKLAKIGGWARTPGLLSKLDRIVTSVANRTISQAAMPATPRLSPEERKAARDTIGLGAPRSRW